MMNKYSVFMAAAVLLAGFSLRADLVHVYEETAAGSVTNRISDRTLNTGGDYETSLAPEISGYIFTHWSTTSKQVFESRDEEGRAWDSAPFHLYEQMTIIANYVEASKDADGDSMADGYELYWYGNLKESPNSDTDGDGYTFDMEMTAGTNPLFFDTSFNGGVVYHDSEECLYNPYGFMPYIVRSEPEGALFATVTNYVAPGAVVTSISCDWVSTKFSYWKMDGVQQRDEDGRAVDSVTFTMPERVIELVAVCEEDASVRQKLYWYGWNVADTSDTDGDGYTYAEEIAAGTNPLFPDTSFKGGIAWKDSDLTQYNPLGMQMYIIRSEPEGQLFASITNHVKCGASVTTPACDYSETDFAYWTMNGVQQRDEDGRAVDSVTFTMPNYEVELVAVTIPDKTEREAVYWYGAATDSGSDTDGDGYTFAQELAAGTNPHFPDMSFNGGIVWKDSDQAEMNLQVYEQVQGAVVDGAFEPLFTSPVAGNGATSATFGNGSQIWPVVADVNDDGKWDLVVCWEKESGGVKRLAFRVYLNVGSSGNPEFVEWKDVSIPPSVDLMMNSTDKLAALTLNVEPINALSATTNGATLLVSDTEGRIWFYEGSTPTLLHSLTYTLQHKVWGGSHAGFANGLRLAAVDWDDDGDLDCICGTAEGKLMLLRDPKVGRPTNLKALAGATSVLLEWDPNSQSRIRGYNVYRAPDAESYSRIVNQTPLPRYRDVPNILQDYWYRITSVSRFYIAGNSTPTVHESMPTDAVYVQFRPSVWLNDTSSFTETNVEVVVSMNNSMGISADGLTMAFTYDPAVLEPVEMKASGLTADMMLTSSGGNGTWTMRATGGEIKTGSGIFMKLVFYVKGVHDVTKTVVTLNAATVKALDGRAVTLELPKSATIEIADSNPLVPAVVAVDVADAAVESETEFVLPVTVTSSEVLTNFVAEVGYDEARLRFDGWRGTIGGDNLALAFYAVNPNSTITNFATTVSVTNIVAIDCNGFSVTADDAIGTVLIKNAHPIVPVVVSVSTEDKKVDTLTEFTLPVTITSNEELKSGVFTVTYDPSVLEWRGESSALVGTGRLKLSATEDFALKFYAKDQHDITQTAVTITDATVVDIHDFTVKPSVPVVATVLIHDAKPLVPAGVILNLADAHIETCRDFSVPITVTTTKELKNLSVKVEYDTSIFEFKGCVGGTWNNGTITAQGSVPRTIILTFHAKDQHTVTKSKMTLSSASARCIDDLVATVTTTDGTMYITDSNVPVPVSMTVATWHVKTKSGEAFKLPVGATTTGGLKELVVTVEWDGSYLTYIGAPSASSATKLAANKYRFTFPCAGEYNLFNLDFKAVEISGLQQNASIRLMEASGTGENNLAATVTTKLPVESTVMIVREIGKYSSGDVDGDGRYTDNDLLILNGYVGYLKMQKKGTVYANNYASQYQSEYHVNVKLTGKAAQAADVNVDGKVDASDISMLQMLISEAEGAGL